LVRRANSPCSDGSESNIAALSKEPFGNKENPTQPVDTAVMKVLRFTIYSSWAQREMDESLVESSQPLNNL
jgi:hypothetical protein